MLTVDTETPFESLIPRLAEAQAAATTLTSRLTAHKQAEAAVLRPLIEKIQKVTGQLSVLHQAERERRNRSGEN
jgi:hypothetical protein